MRKLSSDVGFKVLLILTTIIALGGILYAQLSRPVDISWTASTTTGVTGYNVYRAGSSGVFSIINTAPITTTNYVDTSAQIGKTYSYTVTALSTPCTPTTPVTSVCGESPQS